MASSRARLRIAEVHTCGECGREFNTQQGLASHSKSHGGRSKYVGVRGPLEGRKRRADGAKYYMLDWLNEAGVRQRPVITARSKKAAWEYLQKEKKAGAAKCKLKEPDASLASFRDRFLELTLPDQNTDASRDAHRCRYDNLLTYFGDMALETFTPDDVAQYITHRRKHQRNREHVRNGSGQQWIKKASSDSTVWADIKMLKALFVQAEALKLVSYEVVTEIVNVGRKRSGIKVPKPPRTGSRKDRARWFELDEIEGLLSAAVDMGREDAKRWGHVFPIIYTLLSTGIRMRGVLNLRVKQLDFKVGLIKNIEDKGITSRRTIPMPDHLVPVLKRCVEYQDGGAYVFGMATGEPLPNLRACWKPPTPRKTKGKRRRIRKVKRMLLERAGIEGRATVHHLRHSYATWYCIAGGDILRLRDLMGHGSVTETERYARMASPYLGKTETWEGLGNKFAYEWLSEVPAWLG